MALFLYRVGRFSFRHKWLVVVAWIAAAVVVAGLVGSLNPKFSKDFELPGTDSDKAMSILQSDFSRVNDEQSKASTSIVVAADDGVANHSAQLDQLVAKAKELPKVTDAASIVNPVTAAKLVPQAASKVLGDNGTVGLIQIRQDVSPEDLKPADKERFTDLLGEFRTQGLDVQGTGTLMQVQEQGGTAELLGFAVAFIVMIVAFAALVAAFIPIITGILGVMITIQLVTLGAGVFNINESATGIITMLGIAVSIDYALFIVSRYRSELALGGSRESAAGRAVGTAGSAVVFAGLTVVVAVAALSVVGIPFISQMGLAAALAVLIAVLGALTLIPALLGVFGRFAFSPRIPLLRHGDEPEEKVSNGQRVAGVVGRRPWVVTIAGLVLLAVCALPMAKLELGLSSTTDSEVAATDLLKRGFGEGVNGQLMVVLHSDNGDVARAADDAVGHIRGLDAVATPDQLTWVGNGPDAANPKAGATSALISVTPQFSPSGQQTHRLMEQIRDYSSTTEKEGASLHVGGQTAIMSDISSKLSGALIPYLVLVVGLAFIILTVVFRSLLVPLTATLGFLFSVCATFGATVAIFQEGWFGLISHTQPIISFLPIFLIGVVFGLAMDYQVFLVTRMREEYVHGRTALQAVIVGYKHGARVVASAAIIMISVFASFMLAPDTTSKMMGFALAASVFFDAFVVRMLVVPAMITLMGDRAWQIPRWLDRILPNVDIEGSKIREIPIDHDATPADLRRSDPAPVG
ncbi:MMPL family transporter [Williamsia sterculiae]|uniref:Putative drug exporter of the RND superfamily n=1 Tax=Williamsia sterculiae TaxID=1344003 RepID=A0A1N7FW93_9NOCA|nr:MMPL family transporter [Williamsia sterculiae]SIS04516.1 putative drug exporter of the RND superfamily [Williamsia sterculiae]